MKIKVLLLAIICLNGSCKEEEIKDNQLTTKEKKDGWQLLFDGNNFDQWHLYNVGKKTSSWSVKNGELFCNTDTISNNIEHGDLISDKEYQNFEFKFDWKISKAGNSGVFLNVLELDSLPRAWTTGPEYQLLDHQNIGADYLKDSTKWSACLYGFQKQKNPAPLKPQGEWNQSRIIQKNGNIEFYLNGILTAENDFNSAAWKQKVAQSNFKFFPEFGKRAKGHLGLQEWSKGVAFKNLKIKEL